MQANKDVFVDYISKHNRFELFKALSGTISTNELNILKNKANEIIHKLEELSHNHLKFAKSISDSKEWRHKVSRGYYAAYIASKALRYAVDGYNDTEAGDHKKIGKLPDKFPDVDTWADKLSKFRLDRCLADYDQNATEQDLYYKPDEYLVMAEEFINETEKYLKLWRTSPNA